MNHNALVNDWQQNAESHDQRNYEFLCSLKWKHYRFSPDKLAAELHEEAFQTVDCTRCANCCKTLDVHLSATDVKRVSKHLGMSQAEFTSTHLEPEPENGYWQLRQKPCPFLGEDDRCTIYDIRPKNCRNYPYTDKRGFATRTMLHASNALVCPAVFWIVEQMKRQTRR